MYFVRVKYWRIFSGLGTLKLYWAVFSNARATPDDPWLLKFFRKSVQQAGKHKLGNGGCARRPRPFPLRTGVRRAR